MVSVFWITASPPAPSKVLWGKSTPLLALAICAPPPVLEMVLASAVEFRVTSLAFSVTVMGETAISFLKAKSTPVFALNRLVLRLAPALDAVLTSPLPAAMLSSISISTVRGSPHSYRESIR